MSLFLCFGSLVASAQSVGGTTSGSGTYCSGSNSGFLSVGGYVGTIINWQSSSDGGVTWTNTGNITSAQSYLNLTTTTCYRVIVQNGAFPPDTSTISCITIYLPSDGGTISGGGTFCVTASGTLTTTGSYGNILYWLSSTDGGLTWTTIADTTTTYNFSSVTTNTLFAVVAQNATCAADTSAPASVSIIPASSGGTVSPDDTACYSQNAGTLTLSGYTGTVVTWIVSTDGGSTWSPLAGSTTLSYLNITQSSLYAAVVQNGSCPTDTSAYATITVVPLPIVSAGNDTTLFPGEQVTLQGSGTGTPVWTPFSTLSNPAIFNPVATPTQTTTYFLAVTDANGCINTDDVTITLDPGTFTGIVTTLFTPNGDGINDTWSISGLQNFQDNEVTVFNIYGQIVFHESNYANKWNGTWNGKDLPDGTYYYVLDIPSDKKTLKGSVDIFRNKQ